MKKIISILTVTCLYAYCLTAQGQVPNQSFPTIDLQHFDVPLIPQPSSMSCWITSATMVISWRDQSSYNPADIVSGTGKWQNYFNNNTGLPVAELGFGTAREFFNSLGLTPLPDQCYTVEGFTRYLEEGPIWVAVPGHAVVVTGISGDGTPDGSLVYINDPWDSSNPNLQVLHATNNQAGFQAQNTGQRRVETFSDFQQKMEQTAIWVTQMLETARNNGQITSNDITNFYIKDFYAAH